MYPQIFPFHERPDATVQSATLAWSGERARNWLQVLDRDLLAGSKYLCGDEISIADYFGACFVALGELTRCDYSDFPNVQAWLGRMKQLPSWKPVFEAIDRYAASLKDEQFASL